MERVTKKSFCICSKIFNTLLFLFSNKMLVITAGIHKMLVRIANSEDPDLGLRCLSRLFTQTTSAKNFRSFTIMRHCIACSEQQAVMYSNTVVELKCTSCSTALIDSLSENSLCVKSQQSMGIVTRLFTL